MVSLGVAKTGGAAQRGGKQMVADSCANPGEERQLHQEPLLLEIEEDCEEAEHGHPRPPQAGISANQHFHLVQDRGSD